MTRKKKTKAELKEERRRAMEAKRQETGWEPPEPEWAPDAAMDDARVLFPNIDGDAVTAEDATKYLSVVVDSDWMADEPEFEAIYFPPTGLTNQYVEAAEAAGMDRDAFEQLDEDARSDAHAEFLSQAIRDVLDDTLRLDIFEAIEHLRERLLAEGDRQQAASAGLVLDFMAQESSDEVWPGIGVVSALADRSLEAGIALTRALAAATEAGAQDDFERAPEVQAVLQEYPGLVEHMILEQDRAWEEGLENLYAGELCLDLYTADELEPQLDTWARALDYDEAGEEQDAGRLVEDINRYIVALLTPERVGHILERLDLLLTCETLAREDETFVTSVGAALADEETVQDGLTALIAAFYGEMGLLLAARQDEDGQERPA